MVDPTEDDIGRGVRYVPQHAYVDGEGLKHKDCEDGVVTSYNAYYVFVRYGNDINAKATRRDDLHWWN